MDRNDSDDPSDCPWCAALHEAGLPTAAQPSGSVARRHDPYVSGAQYDGDDW
ncbi:hypothetical protein [Streptomyces sp. NPDC055013]